MNNLFFSVWATAICVICLVGGCASNKKTNSFASSQRSKLGLGVPSSVSGFPATVAKEQPGSLIQLVSGVEPLNRSVATPVVYAAMSTVEANKPIVTLTQTSQNMTLEQVLELALANNPAIKELAATTQKAAGFRTQVGLYANPIMGYQGAQLADRRTDQHLLFAEQEFATAGKLALNRRVLNEALRAQLQELEAQKLRVGTDIRVSFYQILALQRQIELTEEFRGLLDKGYELAQMRLKAAEGSKIDILQTKVQRSEVDIAYRQAKAKLDAAWREMTAIAGATNLTQTRLIGELPQQADAIVWDDLALSVVNSSPEYAAARTRVSQARAALERQGVQAIPNVTVQFGTGVDIGTNSGMMNLQVGAPIPVFNKNQGNIAAARAEYCRAQLEAQRIENGIKARLATISRDYESSAEAISVYTLEILPSAKEAWSLAEMAYKAGEMDFIQVLVARRTYFDSNLQYVNSQAQLATAKAKADGFALSGALDAIIDRSGDDGLRGLTYSQK